MNYSKFLLNKLIDKYEKSPLYTGKDKAIRDITIKFTEKEIPEYFSTISCDYEVINNICMDLELKGYFHIIWKNDQKGHIIEKITLNTHKTNEIYTFLNRREKNDIKKETIELLNLYKGKHNTSDIFIDDMINRINEDKALNKMINLDDINETKHILDGLIGVLSNNTDIFKRNLSARLYKDSKLLEIYENKIVKIIKTYHPEADEIDEDTDVLEEFNIFKNPVMIQFKGDIIFQLGENIYPVKPFINGMGVNSKDLDNISFMDNDKEFNIITIENLTTFNTFNFDNTVVIYIGGFHNHSSRTMLIKLKESCKNAKFYHWGDIDCGGLRIFKHLKQRTNIDFEPYNMDKETYLKYKEFGKQLKKSEIKILKAMKERKEYKVFYELIDSMLETGIKIEQESLILK